MASRCAALFGGAMLAAATPPAVFPGAEFLVLPGLMAWFAVASATGEGARPYRHSYLLGCLHMAWFSWSLRHIMVPAYLAVVVLGGLYFVLGTAAVRALGRRFATPTFAVAVAAAFWLRAEMPEICYPHGQPCHALWQWPVLLGSVAVGGEPLANGLLGGLAAAAVTTWRSWRLAEPAWPRAVVGLASAGGLALVVTVLGHLGSAGDGVEGGHVAIAAVEPGVHPIDPYLELPPDARPQRFRELFEERLLGPTRGLLGGAAPPDLVLWPESSVLDDYEPDVVRAGGGRLRIPLPQSSALLLVGANVVRDGRDTPAAVLVDSNGRVLGHQEKRRLVPGGEFLPLLGWLPAGLSATMRETFRNALGSAPDCVPGRLLPPLRTAAGVPFGALLCYDNAFPQPGADQVAAGARFLCVLSNEAWYRGGGELAQLVAMTVCRALELRTPVVRCTTDGWSLAIGSDGRVLSELPRATTPTPAARILRVQLPLGPGRLPPLAWLRAACGPLAAWLLAFAILHGFVCWARLRVARTAPVVPDASGPPLPPARTGS